MISLELDRHLQALRDARLGQRLQLQAVAARLNVRADTIGRYERGRVRPPHALLVAWSALLDVPIPAGVAGYPPRPARQHGTYATALWHLRRSHRLADCGPCHRAYNDCQLTWLHLRKAKAVS